jgi:hypothetical protein
MVTNHCGPVSQMWAKINVEKGAVADVSLSQVFTSHLFERFQGGGFCGGHLDCHI